MNLIGSVLELNTQIKIKKDSLEKNMLFLNPFGLNWFQMSQVMHIFVRKALIAEIPLRISGKYLYNLSQCQTWTKLYVNKVVYGSMNVLLRNTFEKTKQFSRQRSWYGHLGKAS